MSIEAAKSEETIENQDTKISQKIDPTTKRILRGTVFVISIGAGFIAGTEYGYKTVRDDLDLIFGQPNVQRLKALDVNELSSVHVTDASKSRLQIEGFILKNKSLNIAFEPFASLPNNKQVIWQFRQVAQDHLLIGAYILNRESESVVAKAKTSRNEQTTVTIDDNEYSLENLYEFHQAHSLITLKLERILLNRSLDDSTNDQKRGEIRQELVENQLDWEAIKWLKTQNLEVGASQNSVLFTDSSSLATFARTLRFAKKNNHNIPRIALLGPDALYGGRFVTKGKQLTKVTIIDYNNDGNIYSLVHELAHSIQDEKGPFSQQKFNELMDAVEEENLKKVKDLDNVYFYINQENKRERDEQYAYFFANYFMDGEGLRKRIETLSVEDPYAAYIILAQYNFFKALFQDHEFRRKGLTEKELSPKVEKPKKYEVGQIITVSDKDTQNPGVLLRSTPAGPARENDSAVFDGDAIIILNDSPVSVKYSRYDYELRAIVDIEDYWYYVRIHSRGSLGISRLGDQMGTGFMKENYFGELGRVLQTR